MTRHLLIAGFIFSSSSVALAETADDKPAIDESAETVTLGDAEGEVAEKRGGKGRSGGKSSARGNSSRSGSRSATSSSRSSSRPAASSSSRPAASSSSRPAASSSSRPAASSSRPAASSSSRPAASSSRPAASSSSRPASSSRSGRPNSSSASHAAAANSSRPVSRPSSSRPNSSSRPSSSRPAARPSHQVHHARWAPKRWTPSYHRYHLKSVPHYSPRYWGAGVFYYNPPPRRHNVVVVNRTASGSSAGTSSTKPTRAVNREGDIAFGLRGGTYGTEYVGGGGYSDMGVGLTARFRPVESVGLEVAYEHHSQNFEDTTERINNPLQASVQVYAFPWTRVSPYATLGLTWNSRSITDSYYNNETFRHEVAQADDTLFGPHAGLGLELALGDSAALNFEGRYVNYLNVTQEDASAPGAVQGTAGLNFYF